jgi:rRNA maturation endonuclease Nob1
MRIVINDANILMDLADLDMLELLSSLEYEYHTTDLVIAEVEDAEQKSKIDAFVNDTGVKIKTFSETEFNDIVSLASGHSGLSITDCSVLYYTKETKGILMTGDGKLRKVAQSAKLEVRGILFIFDELVDNNVISKVTAFVKLNELISINTRLPIEEVKFRLEKWGTC